MGVRVFGDVRAVYEGELKQTRVIERHAERSLKLVEAQGRRRRGHEVQRQAGRDFDTRTISATNLRKYR
jgi:hypothetical protein